VSRLVSAGGCDRLWRDRSRLLLLLLLPLLWGCAMSPLPAGPPIVEPAIISAGPTGTALRADDGAVLPLRRWLPAGPPRAVIVALHGFNDYSNAFTPAGQFWSGEAFGIATYAWDQRGFGQAPLPGRWVGQARLQADMRSAVAAVRREHPGVPVVLLGESMGGAVLLSALADPPWPEGVTGAVLTAPAVWTRATMPFYQRWALAVTRWTVPWLSLTAPRADYRQPSDNIAMLRALVADPLAIKSTRIEAMDGLTDLMDAAMEAAPRLAARPAGPLLVLYGEHEKLIPPVARDQLLGHLAAGSAATQTRLYPAGWHLLLRDLQAERVCRDIATWISDPGRPLPSIPAGRGQ
jgi:acylglycerol lipase